MRRERDALPATAPRRGPRGAGERLTAAMLALAGAAELVRHRETRWASITFAGSRHRFTLRFAGAAAVAAGETFIAALPEHEFAIPRKLVADAVIAAAEHRLLPEPWLEVDAEVLLLDDA